MKGQPLFYSFLPSVTAAVLTTQPAVAEAMKVNSVQLGSSPSTLTANDSQTLVADNIQTQLPQTTVSVFPDVTKISELSVVSSQTVSSKSNPVILTETTGIAKEEKSQTASQRNFVQKLKEQRLVNNQKQSNFAAAEPGLVKTVAAITDSKSQLSTKQTFALSSLEDSAPRPNLKTQLPKTLQTAVNGVRGANLLAVNSCSLVKQNQTSLLVTSPACGKSYLMSKQVSQVAAPTNPTRTTAESVEFGQNFPPPETIPAAQVEAQPTPSEPATVTPVTGGAVQVPENLISNPNPLQFPTKPEEVTIQANQPISLAQALELAKRNNRDLQVALLQLERSQAALREAQAALYPNLSVNADISRSQSAEAQRQLEQAGSQQTDQASTVFNGQAQLSYDLYTSGRRQASIKEAEEQVRFNELTVERQAEEIRRNVATEYYNLQEADERVRIAQSAVENAQASLRDAEALERAGVGTRFDVLRSQVNLANAQQELTNVVSRQQIARRTLATRLSLPQGVNISAADPVQLAGLWNQSLEQSLILAYQNRPELQQQLAQRNISEQQRRQALANLGPQVSLIANYNLLDQFDDQISVTDGYSVGVRASLNLFDGGAARARAAQARKNIAIAETQFAEQRNQIRFQVEQAFFTQQANLENVQTANTALEQARESLRLARLRFQAGVGTQTDVINAENELTRAEGNRISAILDYNRALTDLQRAVSSRALP
ncbi:MULTISPECIES: TolC family protein [unclassified Anabaena]|uniref:TolC family protein n=1 Tax=unclassified Anabaena TaxID=2619674 RepID=UPI00082AB464|nr:MULTISPECIES: TolC family protein [unclassified Anabaena]